MARNLRIPTNPTAAAQLLLGGISRAIDLGRWTPDGGVSRTFGVACGAGYDAAIMNSTTRGMKRWLKTGAYLMQSLRNLKHLRPVPYRAIVDGVNLEGEAATILIANCARLFPPYFPIRPTVVLDDGMLDLVAVRADGEHQLRHRFVVGRFQDEDEVILPRHQIPLLQLRAQLVHDLAGGVNPRGRAFDFVHALVGVVSEHDVSGHVVSFRVVTENLPTSVRMACREASRGSLLETESRKRWD